MKAKYNKYEQEYKRATANSNNKYIVKQSVFTAFKWLEDVNTEPWEIEKLVTEFEKLKAEGETELIELIVKGLNEIMDSMEGV